MLVLTRRRGERILIGNDIEVVITRVTDGQVRLAIQAPKELSIVRKELLGKAVSK
jgi:carbon storage regulator